MNTDYLKTLYTTKKNAEKRVRELKEKGYSLDHVRELTGLHRDTVAKLYNKK